MIIIDQIVVCFRMYYFGCFVTDWLLFKLLLVARQAYSTASESKFYLRRKESRFWISL